MEFHEILSEYIETFNCSINELSDSSGLSPSAISRYKSGKRIPSLDSSQLVNLSEGLANLAVAKGFNSYNATEILNRFKESLNIHEKHYELFSQNFSLLINTLSINVKELSQHTNFDISHIYRIKSGQRKPNDLDSFTNKICSYISTYHAKPDDIKMLATLLDMDYSDETTIDEAIKHLKPWLYENCANSIDQEAITLKGKDFLQHLNDFNLNEFIKEIHFDELKIPTVPFRIPSTKTYKGIGEMQKGELDFFKTTVTSRTNKPIYMYSNMPMADMATDIDFGRKWMFGIAASIKKSLILNVIHDVDRPLDEMFLGMTSWIPIYMTGQVNGFYLKDYTADVFHTLTYVSGVCTLRGECIHNHHSEGRYILSSNKDDVEYATQHFNNLLEYAYPLMQVYTEDNKKKLEKYKKIVAENKESIITLSESPFDNIDISINPGEWVMIEKKKSPEITFVIKHTKMVDAFEKYVIPDILK